jgi:hypothetical protein
MPVRKRKKLHIACLESLWDDNVEQKLSLIPVLEIISKLHGVKFIHLPCNTRPEFEHNLLQIRRCLIKKTGYRILYLGFHGEPGRLCLPDGDELLLNELATALGRNYRRWILHLSSCSTLKVSKPQIQHFLSATEISVLAGYHRVVDWAEGASMDLIFLHQILESKCTALGLRRFKYRYRELMWRTGLCFHFRKRVE